MLKPYKNKRRLYYLLFAVAFAFVWYLFKLGGIPRPLPALFSTLIDVSFSLAALIITVELLLPKLFYTRRYRQFVFFFVLVILAAGSLTITCQLALSGNTIISFYQKNMTHYVDHYYYWFWSDLIMGSYFMISFISLGGFAIRLSFDRILTARHVETLEKERIVAELETLKNQINPHFLFNALNTIYYKIDRMNNPARQMVEQFSSLLRYQLYECNEAEVPIEKELKFIGNYIGLQKERLSQSVVIVYDDLKKVKGFGIAPFVLMPLVENCFKHVSQHTSAENRIEISGRAENGYFYFETSNTKLPGEPGNEGGIGLENVKKRLNLVYPGKHWLAINNTGELFNTALKIEIK